MPELPEVESIARGLREWGLTGARVERAFLTREDVANVTAAEMEKRLSGRVIEEVCRRGKNLVLHIEGCLTLVLHLGMSGQVLVSEKKTPTAKHTHFIITFANRDGELRFRDPRRFGFVRLYDCRGNAVPECLAKLGPEPELVSREEMVAMLGRSGRAVKTLLLDQGKIAGIGNIYADEILHRAGIRPMRRARSITEEEAGKLRRAMREVLAEAIKCGGSSVSDYVLPSGKLGYFQKRHRVYQRQGEKCRKCGEVIKKMALGGRGTHWCAGCQK